MANIKKICVINPILPEWSQEAIKKFALQLDFLTNDFTLEFFDPLSVLQNNIFENDPKLFYQIWEKKLQNIIDGCYGIIGFSFGGCILQQFFDYLAKLQKKVILFSTPSFADLNLTIKLKKIIDLINAGNISAALFEHDSLVHYPHQFKHKAEMPRNSSIVTKRLLQGYALLLRTDSRLILKSVHLNYLHFIGQQSSLVNVNNVLYNDGLFIVPNSGMRVLQDNPEFCQPKIMNYLLGGETECTK